MSCSQLGSAVLGVPWEYGGVAPNLDSGGSGRAWGLYDGAEMQG